MAERTLKFRPPTPDSQKMEQIDNQNTIGRRTPTDDAMDAPSGTPLDALELEAPDTQPVPQSIALAGRIVFHQSPLSHARAA